MDKLESINWIIYEFEPQTEFENIEEILERRYWKDDLMTSMSDLHDPFLLKDMDLAVDRILLALKNKERVAIYWDYDVDGVTSTSILMHFFKKIGLEATYRIPNRITDWYGLKTHYIDELSEKWVTLVITVDCWTRDIDVVKHAKTLWVDVIITDHHAVPKEIPEDAIALINPKREDCTYPFKFLAWAWVAFKLMDAVSSKIFTPEEHEAYLANTVDICAIWTVADCMSIVWENRVIVTEGLKRLKNSRSKWIRAIIEDKMNDDLDADIFWFQIWPRINAAGRLDSAYKAVNLILNQTDSVFETLAEIEALNEARKEMTVSYFEEALSQVDANNNIIFFDSEDIAHWIIGIVAGRLTEKFYRPSIVFKNEWDKFVWSCRSPEYFNMVEILEECKDLLMHFWGHKQAAGLSVSKENFPKLKERLITLLFEKDFSERKKVVYVDKIMTFEEIWFKFIAKVNKYKPFWMWNEKPRFIIKNITDFKVEFLWKDKKHLRFTTPHWFKIFAFNMGELYYELKDRKDISLIFDLSEDSWLWKKNIMIKVIDII